MIDETDATILDLLQENARISQADVAREEGAASDREVGRIIEAISEPRGDPGD